MPLIFCTDKTGDGDAMSKIINSELGGGSDTETDRLMIQTSTSTFSYCWGLVAKLKKWPFYCPQGSGKLRQQLFMMHGIA